jgi:DNA-binding MarR family transcriptional regulator
MKGEGSVLYDVYVLGQAVNQMLLDGLAGAPLSPQEYAVLSAIFERGPATPSELSHALGMPAQTMSDWIALFRGRGQVETRRNPRDGRSQLVSLTAAGRRAHRRTNRLFELVYRRFIDELALPEEEARRILARMIGAAHVTRGEREGAQVRER